MLAAGIVAAASARDAMAHPIHSTLAEVTIVPRTGVARIVVRVFADDFATAIARAHADRPPADPGSEALGYVRGALVLSDGDRALPLRFCGTRRLGEVRWVCMETTSRVPTGGLRLRNALMMDLFDDQVNVVRSFVTKGARSVLFTRGDGSKPLT